MKFIKDLSKRLSRKKLGIMDAVLIVVLVSCALTGYKSMYKYDLDIDQTLHLSNPWLVQTDVSGNSYVVDNERSRIVVIDQNGRASRVINGYAPDGNTFYYPETIYVDDEGGVYVHDVWWSMTGFSLDGECILYYTPDGEFGRYVYEAYYDDIYADKHRIFAMTEKDGMLWFVTADESGFSLNSIALASDEASVIATYSLDNAITLIQDFAIDPSTQTIYMVDKRGILLKTEQDGVSQIYDVYENAADGEEFALYHMAVDNDGNIYVTDIASDRLLRFDQENGYAFTDVANGAAIWNVSVNNDSGKISFIRDGQFCVTDFDGNMILEGTSFHKGSNLIKKEILFDLALLFAAISAAYVFLRLISILLTIKYNQTQRIGILVAGTVIIVMLIVVSQLMDQFKTTYRNEILSKLEMSAQIVSNTADVDAIKRIQSPRDYMNDDYQMLLKSIDSTLDKDYEYSDDMYCNILKYNGQESYVIAYIDNSIGAYYPLFDAEAEEVQNVYQTGELLLSDTVSETGSYIYVKAPIYDLDGQVIAVVEVGTLSDVLTNSINAMLLTIIIPLMMIILVILFAFSEIFSFFDLRSRYKEEITLNAQAVPLHIVRFLVFITFMAFNMATSFLPVFILKYVGTDIGIPKELASSIPMSVNLAFIGITSLVCARLQNAFGFKKVAAISAGFALVGDLLMAIAQNYSMIVVGLVLNGIGVGIITNSIHMFIASSKFGKDQSSGYGFSIFNAASLSGINIGMIFGAGLAENLGQNNVFFVTTAAWLVVMVIFLLLGRSIRIEHSGDGQAEQGSISLKQFLCTKNVLCFMAFVQVPYIVMNSFNYFFVPIFAESKGLGESESCMLIMISSLCSVYLSVSLTSYLSKKIRYNTIYLSSFITFAALILFAVNMSVPMLIVSLIMIGIANSFGTSSRVEYFTSSKEAEAYGKDRAMGIYNFVDNIGESAGPVVLASIISTGFLGGIIKLVSVFTGLNGLFALSKLGKKNEKIAVKK